MTVSRRQEAAHAGDSQRDRGRVVQERCIAPRDQAETAGVSAYSSMTTFSMSRTSP